MLIDTREPPPEPGDDGGRGWRPAEVMWRLRWVAVVGAMLLAAYLTSGWLSVGVSYAALYVAFWRGLKMMPTVGGMRDYFQ